MKLFIIMFVKSIGTPSHIIAMVICPGNIPWLLAVGICSSYCPGNLPQLFAVAFCRGNLPQLFTARICRGNLPLLFSICRFNCNVIISNWIERTDNCQANNVNEKVNQLPKNWKLHVINNDNKKNKQLGKRGLQLNSHGNVLLANYVLHAIRNPKWNTDHND